MAPHSRFSPYSFASLIFIRFAFIEIPWLAVKSDLVEFILAHRLYFPTSSEILNFTTSIFHQFVTIEGCKN